MLILSVGMSLTLYETVRLPSKVAFYILLSWQQCTGILVSPHLILMLPSDIVSLFHFGHSCGYVVLSLVDFILISLKTKEVEHFEKSILSICVSVVKYIFFCSTISLCKKNGMLILLLSWMDSLLILDMNPL